MRTTSHGPLVPGALVVVTDSFPCNLVTEFVDDELPYLRDRFASVEVAPLHRATACAPESVPSGVGLDLGLSRQVRHFRLATWLSANVGELRGGRWGLIGRSRWILRCARAASLHQAVTAWCAARQQPAMAYTYWLGPATAAIASAWPGTVVVSRAHGHDLYAQRHRPPAIPFQSAAMAGADLVMTVSTAGREHLHRQFPDATVVTRRLGIRDLGGLCPPSTDATIRAVSVSSADPNKRVIAVAQALMALARSGRRVEWLHFGDGTELDGVKTLLASEVGLPLSAEFPGWRPRSEVMMTLRRGPFDVMVLLSLSEGAPVSLMEAQCVGIPCVATRVGGVGEVLTDQWDVLVPPDATETQVAAAIQTAAGSAPHWRERRRHHWHENYDAHRNYTELADDLALLASNAGGDS